MADTRTTTQGSVNGGKAPDRDGRGGYACRARKPA
jgi:hypothetical protein